MKKNALLILGLLFIDKLCYCQYYKNDTICSNDIVPIYRYVDNRFKLFRFYDPVVIDHYARCCETRSKIGYRLEIGVSKYQYSESVSNWIGNHWGSNFNFIIVYNKLNFGFRFKPWTVNPKSELLLNNNLLTHDAELNPIKIDYYTGYSFDFQNNISIEPSIGYTISSFHVINEKELNTTFDINSCSGLILGVTLNKYIKTNKYEHISMFSRISYGFVDYQRTHNNLGFGYYELNLGLAYKYYFEKRFYKRI